MPPDAQTIARWPGASKAGTPPAAGPRSKPTPI